MFNLNINWLKVLKENIPLKLHTVQFFDWLKVLIAAFNKIHTELLQAYDIFILKIRYTGQICYLEKILNNKYSPVSGGIYITNGVAASRYFLYNKIEGKTPRYLYFNWKSATPYLVGKFAVYQNKVWKCLVANTNSTPSLTNTDWAFHKDVEYLYTNSEFSLIYNFIVKVPSSLTVNLTEMRALIDYYRLAGMRYKIETY